MEKERLDPVSKVRELLATEKKVKFAYLFGSAATGKTGPLSDFDFAVYLDRRVDPFMTRLLLMESMAKVLKSERFDLVVLNSAPVSLLFEVVKHGTILKEDRSRRVIFETGVLREYLDSAHLRNTQCSYLKESFSTRSHAHG